MARDSTSSAATPICKLDDIPIGGSREFCLQQRGTRQNIFLLRLEDRVVAFHNLCPHQGRSLSYATDSFLISSGSSLVCPHHGAAFRLPDGLCIEGPCSGDSLQPVDIFVRSAEILLAKAW